jgi:hypothetical protein
MTEDGFRQLPGMTSDGGRRRVDAARMLVIPMWLG